MGLKMNIKQIACASTGIPDLEYRVICLLRFCFNIINLSRNIIRWGCIKLFMIRINKF